MRASSPSLESPSRLHPISPSISSPSHPIQSHHTISHHFTSHHITSHHITSHHITSHHITSHHITSHHISFHPFPHRARGRHRPRRSRVRLLRRRGGYAARQDAVFAGTSGDQVVVDAKVYGSADEGLVGVFLFPCFLSDFDLPLRVGILRRLEIAGWDPPPP